MSVTFLTSSQFKLGFDTAKEATKTGPIYIQDSDMPSHVFLTYEEYTEITRGQSRSALDESRLVKLMDL